MIEPEINTKSKDYSELVKVDSSNIYMVGYDRATKNNDYYIS